MQNERHQKHEDYVLCLGIPHIIRLRDATMRMIGTYGRYHERVRISIMRNSIKFLYFSKSISPLIHRPLYN